MATRRLPGEGRFDRAVFDEIVARHFAGDPAAAWAAMREDAWQAFRPATRREERAVLSALSVALDRHVRPERHAVLRRLIVTHLATPPGHPVDDLLDQAAQTLNADPADPLGAARLRDELYDLLLRQPNSRALDAALAIEGRLHALEAADATGTRPTEGSGDGDILADDLMVRARRLLLLEARLQLKRRFLAYQRQQQPGYADDAALVRAIGLDPDTFWSDSVG